MKRYYRLIFILSVFLIFVTGCATAIPTTFTAPTDTPAPTPSNIEQPTTAPAAFPLTLTDDLGRQVTVKAEPKRIVSLLPSNTEILFAVGAGEQVVGVTSFCNYPEAATKKEQVGGITVKSLSLEKIVALQPDVVLASGSQQEIIPALDKAGLTVIALEPATFDDIFANIELVGRVAGHIDQAQSLTSQLRQRVAAVKAKVDALPADQRPTVFYEVWHDPLMTAGPDTFIGQLITLAGGKNIFDDVAEDWPQVSAETIVQRNPAVILGPSNHLDELTTTKISARPGWSNIAAVKNNRIYILDGDMVSRPGPRIVDMLEQAERDLYNDR